MKTIALRVPDTAPGDVPGIHRWCQSCDVAGVQPGLDLVDVPIVDRLIDVTIARSRTPALVVRVRPTQVDELLSAAPNEMIVIVVDSWMEPVENWAQMRAVLLDAGATPWLEVANADRVRALNASTDVLVARGSESGGPIGSVSTSILVQQCRNFCDSEVLAFGAISPSIAAALRTAGVDGIILRDELVLTKEMRVTGLRSVLRDCDGTESVAVGPPDHQVRFLLRGNLPTAQSVHVKLRAQTGQPAIKASLNVPWGWRSVFEDVVPIGQGIAIAEQSAGRPLTAVLAAYRETDDTALRATAEGLLNADSALCRELGLGVPLIQGPMTRVSDVPGFAGQVADAGALPLIALALKRGPVAAQVLEETDQVLGTGAWGVGMLGFAPEEILEPQRAAVLRARPTVAVIAGARPEQVIDLESFGIHTYAHAPTARIVSLLWKAGVRRFVLEGFECGGHVGPLCSAVLWQTALREIAEMIRGDDQANASVFLAGGIHDAVSAASAAALVAGELGELTDRVSVGFLMGTAYLFTKESVVSGAIPQAFQDVALACERTRTVTTSIGHSTRVALSDFVHEFDQRAAELESADPELRSRELESLTLGRLRMASRAEIRQEQGVVSVDLERQLREGMFMLGDVATLHTAASSIADLHRDVLEGGREVLARCRENPQTSGEHRRQAVPIAIVGMSVVAPGASNLAEFWETVVQQRIVTSTIPPERFDPARVRDPDPNAPDPMAATHGGFLDPVPFDPIRFGTPPTALPHIEPAQLIALEVTRRALADAGIDGDVDSDQLDRSRVGVILGMSSSSGDIGEGYAARAMLSSVSVDVEDEAWSRLPSWTEESFPGFLNNVTTGRIANRFNFQGPNHTVDSACASSLAAVEAAIRELETGRTDVVITGGADTAMAPRVFLSFAASHALSPRDRPHVFDESADGIVIGEAVGVLILKRLSDAERDGDRIYAVIRGSGSSSDGRGLSLTAPQSSGQQLALRRAYESCDVDPGDVGFYEAHGTGTVVGDRTEVSTIREVRGDTTSVCAIGSIKAQMGHAKAGAGVLGLMKAALALYQGVRPGQPSVATPIDALRDPEASVVIYDQSVPWLDPVRRAGVSAFGFGGTNTHLVLQAHDSASGGGPRWPAELLVIGAESPEAAVRQAERLTADLQRPGSVLRVVAQSAARQATGKWRWAGVVSDSMEAVRILADCAQSWSSGDLVDLIEVCAPPVVAQVYPGQAAQRVRSLREASVYLPELRRSWSLVDAVIGPHLPYDLLGTMYPFRARSDEEVSLQRARIADTRMAQAALAAVGLGLDDLLHSLGVEPVLVFGHSYGEFIALHRAGVISREDLLDVTRIRGSAMASSDDGRGVMAALEVDQAQALELVEGLNVCLACFNAPTQVVVSGVREDIETVVERALERGSPAVVLPVGGAFHSDMMSEAVQPLVEAICGYRLRPPQLTVIGNADGTAYPPQVEAIRDRMCQHLQQPVKFIDQVCAAVDAGVTLFIEIGPGSTASKLIQQTVPSARVVAMERPGRPMSGILDAIAELWMAGAVNNVQAIFESRESVPGEDALQGTGEATWFVDGGGVRRGRMSGNYDGRAPLLTAQTAQPTTSPRNSGDGVVAFQHTMQEFLRIHEQVMEQALGNAPTRRRFAPPRQPPVRTNPTPMPIAARHNLEQSAQGDPTPNPSAQSSHTDTFTSTSVDIGDVLVELICDRTGFDPSVIGLDMDLESELGVDSIKRVEILSGLRDRLGIVRQEGVDLSRLRTVREIVAALHADQRAVSGDGVVDLPRNIREWAQRPAGDEPAFQIADVTIDSPDTYAGALVDAVMDALGAWQEKPLALSTIGGQSGLVQAVSAAARCVVAEQGDEQGIGIRITDSENQHEVQARLSTVALQAPETSSLAGQVVLAFGGARGITREAIACLTECTLIVIGRSTAQRDLPEGWYGLQADVRDRAQVDDVVTRVLRDHGRIDGVVFGAGILHDAPLAEVNLARAREVIETKVLGLNHVCQALSQASVTPQWLIAFGSVTGPFGNPAQSAYAAANEAMTFLAEQWASRWPDSGVRVLQWGPWFGEGLQGMVSEVVAALLTERGIQVIDPESGGQAFLAEVCDAAQRPGFVDVVIGSGPWTK